MHDGNTILPAYSVWLPGPYDIWAQVKLSTVTTMMENLD